jgi:hypothetical protein
MINLVTFVIEPRRLKTCACLNMTVFCVLEPCILVEVCRLFRGASCFRHQGDDGSGKHL